MYLPVEAYNDLAFIALAVSVLIFYRLYIFWRGTMEKEIREGAFDIIFALLLILLVGGGVWYGIHVYETTVEEEREEALRSLELREEQQDIIFED
jgi:hypothetical protein